jgi:hypothetical protein
MKTAVEWLYDQIENEEKCIYEVMEQAKLIEIDQMRAVHVLTYMNKDFDFEQYIKEHHEQSK